MIEIDGSIGEGGGQVLRSCLSLSAITGQAFRLTRIRARRPQPGLKSQHRKAVEAAAAVCGARVEGAALGSRTLSFEPGPVAAGDFSFDIGTAGSTSLVLQTILPALSVATAVSRVDLRGGTHVRWSPCFDYLKIQWLPFLRKIGFDADLEMLRAGFYPVGGGLLRAAIRPAGQLTGMDFLARGALRRIHGVAAVARLDLRIAERLRDQALRRLSARASAVELDIVHLEAPSPGAFLLLRAEFESSSACFWAPGERGKPAERVADEAVSELDEFLASPGAIDPYLGDQLVLPLALAAGASALAVSRVTGHLVTNAEIVRRFLPAQIEVGAPVGQPGVVRIEGTAFSRGSPARVSRSKAQSEMSFL
ncbi:MAG: RNA 3'-terminal phosphate cyclase [Acidobacteriota bacterium]